MNKKLLSILALVLMVCVLFVSCQEPAPEEPPHEHTFDTASWSSDATMHWHKATCEHTSEMKDVQGHVDANIDGVCDVCAYAADHTHTFVEDWSYDATGHWHVANCFHDVKSEVVAHTADGMGFCTACGYKVNDPDVSTVKKAVEMGVAQKKTVKTGTITTDDGSVISFEFRNGYLYVKNNETESFITLLENGTVFALDRYYSTYYYEYIVERDMLATEDNLLGPKMPGAFLNHEYSFFGTEDLIETLYAMGSADNLNGDFAESVTEGVYSFSFGHYIEWYGLYQVKVSFTLNETTYCFENVTVTSTQYDTNSITEVPGATAEDMPTYTVNQGAEAAATYSFEVAQGVDAEFPFDPSVIIATGFDLADADGNVVTTITLTKGEYLQLNLVNIVPDTTLLDLMLVTFAGENVNLEWEDENAANSLTAMYYNYDGYVVELYSNAEVGTTYTLTVSVEGVEKTYAISVVAPVASTITAGEITSEYGNLNMTVTDSITMTEGENVMVGAYLDKGFADSIAITLTGATFDEALADKGGLYDENWNMKYVAYYNLSSLAVGEYTVTFTCKDNAALTATVTVTVTEAGSTGGEDDIPATGLGGTYLGTNTTPGIEPATITVVIDEAAGTVTYTFIHPRTGMEASVVYNYTVADGIVTLTQVDDNSPVFPMEACLFVDENGVAVFAGYNGYDYELTKQSGGDEGGNEGGAPTTLSGTFEGTSEYGTTIKVTIDEVSETVVFSYYDGRLGMEVEASFYFVLQNGAMQLLDDFGEPVMAMMASVELVDGVINSVTYNGTGYSNFVTVGGSGDEPAGVALQIGNNGIEGANVTYTYTATESGSLTLNIGVAIMGSVSVSYTVNGGDPVVLVTGEDSTVALSAGDEVEITVEASGYATLAASFTAGTTGGEGGEITPPPATGGDDLGDDEFAGAN